MAQDAPAGPRLYARARGGQGMIGAEVVTPAPNQRIVPACSRVPAPVWRSRRTN
jgi:hypothetical protein